MITLRDVKQSPSERKENPVKDFEMSVRELIDSYRNQYDKGIVVNALRTQADLLDRDAGWTKRSADEPDPDLSDPASNPLGARPAPRGATRADEETAPEPDSGAVQDRLAGENASISQAKTADGRPVPPPDEDAVKAKEGKAASDAAYGDELDEENPDPSRARGASHRAKHAEDDKSRSKK
jgi:hypothetical protein